MADHKQKIPCGTALKFCFFKITEIIMYIFLGADYNLAERGLVFVGIPKVVVVVKNE